MGRCEQCGRFILFGGRTFEGLRFCSEKCLDFFESLEYQSLTLEEATEIAYLIHGGPCPRCGRNAKVDIHTSHRIWSVLYFTIFRSYPVVSCRLCGVIEKLKGVISCFFLGWWSIPVGVIVTPIYVIRNMVGILTASTPPYPSEALVDTVLAGNYQLPLDGSFDEGAHDEIQEEHPDDHTGPMDTVDLWDSHFESHEQFPLLDEIDDHDPYQDFF